MGESALFFHASETVSLAVCARFRSRMKGGVNGFEHNTAADIATV